MVADRRRLRAGRAGGGRREKKADGSGGQSEQGFGRGRGGFGGKPRAAVSCLGHPVALTLTGAQAGDGPRLPALIAGRTTAAVIADKAHDSNANRAATRRAGAGPVVPPKKNRKGRTDHDRHLYKERHAAECYFGKLKQHRRAATRHEKKAANYLGCVWLASINITLL